MLGVSQGHRARLDREAWVIDVKLDLNYDNTVQTTLAKHAQLPSVDLEAMRFHNS